MAQPGVPVEPADSALEREAEAAARAVVRGPASAPPTVRQGAQVAGAVARVQRPDVVAPPLPPGVERRAPTARAALDAAHASPDAGEPLSPTLRATLEERFGTDLSDVRVHRDGSADLAARELQARAFTEGRHVWLAQGELPDDLALMAHEVAHVLQQRATPGALGRVMRNGRGRSAAAPAADEAAPAVDPTTLPTSVGQYARGAGSRPGRITFDQVGVPGFKRQAHRGESYDGRIAADRLMYRRNYQRGNPDQRNRWRRNIAKDRIVSALQAKETEAHAGPYEDATHYFKVDLGGRQQAFYFGTLDEIAAEMALPTWAWSRGRSTEFHRYDVDHVVELQLAYWPQDEWANQMANYELLDSEINQQSGRLIKADIDRRVQGFIDASAGAIGRDVDQLKDRFDLKFLATSNVRGAPSRIARDKYWTTDEIERGDQLRPVRAAGPGDIGRSGEARLIGRERGGISKRFTWSGGDRPVAANRQEANWLEPFVIVQKQFRTGSDEVDSEDFGTLWLSVPPNDPLWRRIRSPRTVEATRIPGARYAGTINKAAVRRALSEELKIKGASPIEVEHFDIESGGIVAGGRVASDIPLLREADIRWSIENGEAQVYKVFSAPEIPLPAPLSIDDLSLTLFASSRRGLGVDGDVAFSITGLGHGEITATAATDEPLRFGGHFDFDTRYFDPARVAFAYDSEAGQWTGSGELGLKPNTVPGVESATGRVDYDGTALAGSLTVVPQLRAIQQGQLDFRYSATEGARFDGRLMLSDAIPNVRGGALQVVLTQPPEGGGWRLSASADLASSFAGFNQQLHVEYDDGGFVVEGGGDFRRGMLAGQVTIGATNYAVDEAGQRGDVPTEVITAYGSGQVSVALTPWLTATGRIRLLPIGEIELFGELALPPTLDVFDEIAYERRLFELNLDIPIIGFAVAGQRIGIFATIGGGLDLSAGIGPGQLRDTRLNVSYNPAHEDQTTIHGQATFAIPAHAEIRAFIRGALGAGIPVVSAELGLEAGGALGLAGEASAAAAVDWAPGRGLVLDATGSIFVEPRFRFDLTGFLEVTADLWVTEIDLYSQRWELAAFEVGSALRLGIEFPVHYEEGQPFQVSWDDVRFTVPEIDFGDLMADVIERVV